MLRSGLGEVVVDHFATPDDSGGRRPERSHEPFGLWSYRRRAGPALLLRLPEADGQRAPVPGIHGHDAMVPRLSRSDARELLYLLATACLLLGVVGRFTDYSEHGEPPTTVVIAVVPGYAGSG